MKSLDLPRRVNNDVAVRLTEECSVSPTCFGIFEDIRRSACFVEDLDLVKRKVILLLVFYYSYLSSARSK
jgi:hypothetical protein